MNKIEKIAQNIVDHLPMDAKKIVLGSTILVSLMAGCGRVVDTNQPTTPAPTTSIETTIDDPEVDVPVDETVVDPGEVTDKPGNQVSDEQLPEATFVQTDDNAYTVYVDCPDNSNAPELSVTSSNGSMAYLSGSSNNLGVSENLILAVMTHGMQVDPNNAAQINYEAYMDKPFELNRMRLGTYTYVLTNDPSAYASYGDEIVIFTPDMLQYDDPSAVSTYCIEFCTLLLKHSIESTNGNITCALARYNMGPANWDIAMQECMDATGLTAEQIYASCDSAYVLSFDTQGLGDPNYANEVLQYVSDPIVVTDINANGVGTNDVIYTIDRAKTYGQR